MNARLDMSVIERRPPTYAPEAVLLNSAFGMLLLTRLLAYWLSKNLAMDDMAGNRMMKIYILAEEAVELTRPKNHSLTETIALLDLRKRIASRGVPL